MATRKDIADKANVSISVVSRALNNSGYVEANKKKRILEIAEELGYRPNPIAMSLATRRTKQIIFFCKELENAYNIEMYEGMMKAAKEQGYMVLIQGDMDFTRIPDMMADGIILPNDYAAAEYMAKVGKRYHLPAVSASFSGNVSCEKSIPFIECDLWKGARMIEDYLWKRDHRDIAVVMPYALSNDNPRIDAWRSHVKDFLGKRLEDYYIGVDRESLRDDTYAMSFWEEQGLGRSNAQEDFFGKGILAGKIFHQRKINATAVICFNDEMALGFYKQVRKLGYQVPEDISIISYDGTYSRRYADIELTSLALNGMLQGQKCMEILLKIIRGEKYKYITRIPLRILEGESVKTIKR